MKKFLIVVLFLLVGCSERDVYTCFVYYQDGTTEEIHVSFKGSNTNMVFKNGCIGFDEKHHIRCGVKHFSIAKNYY